jgi:outer membrane protein TolC
MPPAQTASAQAAPVETPPPEALTLDQAMRYAVVHYPTVRAALERVNASAANARVARSAYLPRFDSTWQSNLATTNNVFGQVLPQSVIPALSGPVLPTESNSAVYGSAAGVLLSWQALDFGLRKATVLGAEAAVTQARAGEAMTRLEVQSAVGAAFLDVLAAERAVAVTGADLERRDVLSRIVHTLVDNELRPGAEASRADAERAASQTRLIQAQANLAVAHTTLARVLGVTGGEVTVEGAGLLEELPPPAAGDAAMLAHPLAQFREAEVEVARAQSKSIARTDLPQIYLQSSIFARGSGAQPDGQLDTGSDGLNLDRDNWAVGVQIRFPDLFAFASLGARKAAAEASEREATARYDEALLTIDGQRQTAAAVVDAAQAVAAHTPIQLAAARESETQARARYQAGLAGLVEVADAQSLLARAEVQDQLARVDVWRALLAQAVAQGDLEPFSNLLHLSSGR